MASIFGGGTKFFKYNGKKGGYVNDEIKGYYDRFKSCKLLRYIYKNNIIVMVSIWQIVKFSHLVLRLFIAWIHLRDA